MLILQPIIAARRASKCTPLPFDAAPDGVQHLEWMKRGAAPGLGFQFEALLNLFHNAACCASTAQIDAMPTPLRDKPQDTQVMAP